MSPQRLQVLEMRERTLGGDHAEVAGALNNLAVLLKSMGRYDEAQALHEKSIKIKEKALGHAHPQVCAGCSDLPHRGCAVARACHGLPVVLPSPEPARLGRAIRTLLHGCRSGASKRPSSRQCGC